MMYPPNPADRALVRGLIRDVADFPSPGILFRDITPILNHGAALQAAISLHGEAISDLWVQDGGPELEAISVRPKFDRICGIESRGFLFGMALADRLGVGFFPARKPGKLPAETVEQSYALEYGSDRLQIHKDAVQPGERVLVVDDLLATGGTANAAAQLIEVLGGIVVGVLVLIELVPLNGRTRLDGRRVNSVFTF